MLNILILHALRNLIIAKAAAIATALMVPRIKYADRSPSSSALTFFPLVTPPVSDEFSSMPSSSYSIFDLRFSIS